MSLQNKFGFIKICGMKAVLVSVIVVLNSSCGGGGGSEATSTNSGGNTPQVSLEKISFSGTIATGLPVKNQEIKVQCKNGNYSGFSDTNGKYEVRIPDLPPCSFSATLGNGEVLKSIAVISGTTNITPLTTLGFEIAGGKAENIEDAKSKLKSALNSEMGIVLENDPFTTPFDANRAGLDYQLEEFTYKVNQLYGSQSGAGSTLPIKEFSADISTSRSPSINLNFESEIKRNWLKDLGVNTYKYLTSPIDPTIDIEQYKNQPLVVKIVGGASATTWNFVVAIPSQELVKLSDSTAIALADVVHTEKDTSGQLYFVYTPEKVGPTAWNLVVNTGKAAGTVASPGKFVTGFCVASNDIVNGFSRDIGYQDTVEYCNKVGDIADVLNATIRAVGEEAPKIADKVSKINSYWNNNTYIMNLGRKHQLKSMVGSSLFVLKTAYKANQTFQMNDLEVIRKEYVSMLEAMGYTKDEVDSELPDDMPSISGISNDLAERVGGLEMEAKFGVRNGIIILGKNLPKKMVISVDGGVCNEDYYSTINARYNDFHITECDFTGIAGTRNLVIKDGLTGNLISSKFKIKMTAPLADTGCVSSHSGAAGGNNVSITAGGDGGDVKGNPGETEVNVTSGTGGALTGGVITREVLVSEIGITTITGSNVHTVGNIGSGVRVDIGSGASGDNGTVISACAPPL